MRSGGLELSVMEMENNTAAVIKRRTVMKDLIKRLERYLELKFGRMLTRAKRRALNADIESVGVRAAFNPPRHFPKGHVREYDPTGVRTYHD